MNLMLKFSLIILSLVMPFYSLSAQDIMALLSPDVPGTSLDVDGLLAQDRQFDKSGKRSTVKTQNLEISQRVYKVNKNQVTVGLRYQKLDFSKPFP
jgi:hypothetical protein